MSGLCTLFGLDADGDYLVLIWVKNRKGARCALGRWQGWIWDWGKTSGCWVIGTLEDIVVCRGVLLICVGSFMKNVYTVFDTGNSSVGFAELSES